MSQAKEEKKEDLSNLWQDLLKKASKKTLESNSTLIVLGDPDNGKGETLDAFRDRVCESRKKKAGEYFVEYSYTNVKNKYDDEPEEIRAYMNIWQINNKEQMKAVVPGFVKANGLGSTAYCITFDLSKPWDALASVKEWAETLYQVNETILHDAEDEKELRLAVSKYNQCYVDPSLGEEAKKAAANDDGLVIDETQPLKNLGAPLILVGCNGEKLGSAFSQISGSGDKFHFLSSQLRLLCLQYGATMIFTSKRGDNVDLLQDYIYHRIYNFEMKASGVLVGNENEFGLYVPAGMDNEDMIKAIQPANSWDPSTPFEDVFVKPAAKKVSKSSAKKEVKVAKDNQEFFKELEWESQQKKSAIQRSEGKRASKAAESATRKLDRVAARPGAGASLEANDTGAVKDFFEKLLQKKGKK